MLNEKELDGAAHQLAEYRQNNSLSQILERYSTLIDDYKRLKSDYEEEREGREKYKQMARGQERNPFVLVLVDGDGYVFNEDVVSSGSEGGIRAARQLNDTVKASLRMKGLEGCDVMIRVYADLVGLSKALSRNGLCGPEKRSLAPFIASFNRSYGLTDFVDAGELKENTDFKLRAMLRLYAENAQCKHIFFAACHDVGYITELTPYRGNRERFTLVQTSGLLFHDEFTKLGLGIEELPGVFRTTSLGGSAMYTKPVPTGSNRSSISVAASSSTHPHSPTPLLSASDGRKVCKFYPLGKCTYGKICKNLHIGTKPSGLHASNQSSLPSHQARASRTDSELTNGFDHNTAASTGDGHDGAFPYPLASKVDLSSKLPKKDEIPDGYIALNQNQQRLDAYISPPSIYLVKRLRERSGNQKLCNNKHIAGSCDNESCEYDHTPLEEDLKPALEWLSRSVPCAKRERCRNATCVNGHVCQSSDCKQRGGKAFCRIPYGLHFIEFTLDRCIPAAVSRSDFSHQRSPTLSDDEEEEEDMASSGADLYDGSPTTPSAHELANS